jgi:hypothetical protein
VLFGCLGGAIAGVLLKMFWPSAPRWLGVPLYILWAGWRPGSSPDHAGRRGGGGGTADRRRALYSIGGVSTRSSGPTLARTFGHHEFFHACTACGDLHKIAMWFAVFSTLICDLWRLTRFRAGKTPQIAQGWVMSAGSSRPHEVICPRR